VDAIGLTSRAPEASTVPMPPSMVTLDAFEELQRSIAVCPRSIVAGEADRVRVGAGAEDSAVGEGSVPAAAGGGDTFFAQPAAVTRIANAAKPTITNL